MICIGCNKETHDFDKGGCPICKSCGKEHSIAGSLYARLCIEETIPSPFTYWEWDDALAKGLWQLALKQEKDLLKNGVMIPINGKWDKMKIITSK